LNPIKSCIFGSILLAFIGVPLGSALPDLAVLSIETIPSPPLVGLPTMVIAEVQNLGDDSVGNGFQGQFYVDGHPFENPRQFPAGLPPGHGRMVVTYWTPSERGLHRLGFFIDVTQNVTESDESQSSNYHEIQVTAEFPPDLVVDSIKFEPPQPVSGESVTIKARIRNAGYSLTDYSFWCDFYVNGSFLASKEISEYVGPGAAAEIATSWIPATSGTYVIRLHIDGDDYIREMDETNNEKTVLITVSMPKLADLVVTDVWHEADLIVCQIMNIGAGFVPSGVRVELWIDGYVVDSRSADGLRSRERRYVQFGEHQWRLKASTALIKVCADPANRVPEANESNNCRVELWKSDEDPPVIMKGPSVTVTSDSATIMWRTDEPSNSVLRLDESKPVKSKTVKDASLVIDHAVIVTDLKPSTGYAFYVESSDASGNLVRSQTCIFFTAAAQDLQLPTVRVLRKTRDDGTPVLQANVSDDIGVSRVEFYIDGHLHGTTCSYPYELPLDEAAMTAGLHGVVAHVFDLFGNTAQCQMSYSVEFPEYDGGPIIVIINPREGDTLSGKVQMRLTANDRDGIETLEIYMDAERIYSRTGVPALRTTDADPWMRKSEKQIEAETSFNITLVLDTLNWDNGAHQLLIRGWDIHDNVTEWTLHITIFNAVPRHRPSLVLTRPAAELHERPGPGSHPGLVVTLQIRNAGNAAARNIIIEDVLHGFCPTGIHYTIPSSGSTLSTRFYRSASFASALMQIPELGAGESLTIKYAVVPILREIIPFHRNIGATVIISYNGTQGDHYDDMLCLTTSDVSVQMETPPFHWSTGDVVSLPDAVSACLYCSDYLIVTCPGNMFMLPSTDEEVSLLLQSMARLAWIKEGALAFLDSARESTMRTRLCELIWHDGYWSEQLDPDYPHYGYLLIVGESDIVPSWHHRSFDIIWESGGEKHVDLCDTDYADSNSDWKPEIIVGRIIGESANALRIPIDASIAVAEGGAGEPWPVMSALLISGYGDHYEVFEESVDECAAYLWVRCGRIEKLAMRDYFELDRFDHEFTRNDGLAIGDVTGGSENEIVIAKDDNHMLYIYDSRGSLLMSQPWADFDADCIMRTVARTGLDRIAILDPGAGLVKTRSADGTDTGSTSVWSISGYCDFATGDLDADGQAEYVLASDEDNRIYIYGSFTNSFPFQFTEYDHIAVGNVVGDSREEIVIAKDDDNAIYIYQSSATIIGGASLLGTITSTGHTYYTRSDKLAVGDVCDDGMDEIVIGMNDDGFVRAYNAAGQERGNVDLGFTEHDQLAVGDLLGDAKEEIVIARDDDGKVIIADLTWAARIAQDIRSHSLDTDVIMFRGHGSPNNWNCFGTRDVPSDYSSATPIVCGFTCLSGNYEDGAIAETFLGRGAAVYIGSTMVSPTNINKFAAKRLLGNWVNTDRTIGQAFKQTERDVEDRYEGIVYGDFGKFWVAEYNLYGDPKFGSYIVVGSLGSFTQPENPKPSIGSPAALSQSAQPQSDIEVQIPQLQISAQNGYHFISLPDGGFTMEEGMPQLPTYLFTVPVASGLRVNDVILVEKRGELVYEGIELPPLKIKTDQGQSASSPENYSYPEGTYPPKEYSWKVAEDDAGDRLLLINICPVEYNLLTARLIFWQSYLFRIQYSQSIAGISQARPRALVYGVGEEVRIDVCIELNQGNEIDAILYGSVRSYESLELLSGTKLQSLTVRGRTYASLTWDALEVPPGGYVLEIVLTDSQGNVLDSRSVRFWLEEPGTSMTEVTASPSMVAPSGTVTAAVTLFNDGDSRAEGSVVIWIMDTVGRILVQCQINGTSIMPHSTSRLEHALDLPGLAEGEYWIGAWAWIDGESAGSGYASFLVSEALSAVSCLVAVASIAFLATRNGFATEPQALLRLLRIRSAQASGRGCPRINLPALFPRRMAPQ